MDIIPRKKDLFAIKGKTHILVDHEEGGRTRLKDT